MVGRKYRARKKGLSPRVRRHQVARNITLPRNGSISACAEASVIGVDEGAVLEVYLRVCGGIDLSITPGSQQQGLSPRVRRHQWTLAQPHPDQRSISACAEASKVAPRSTRGTEVYLRVCGGIRPQCLEAPADTGLSPRVRRHQQDTEINAAQGGSISACAEASEYDRDRVPCPRSISACAEAS
mgnify:CR=1 FL=1